MMIILIEKKINAYREALLKPFARSSSRSKMGKDDDAFTLLMLVMEDFYSIAKRNREQEVT